MGRIGPRTGDEWPGDEMIACLIENVVYQSQVMGIHEAWALGRICKLLRDRAEAKRLRMRPSEFARRSADRGEKDETERR